MTSKRKGPMTMRIATAVLGLILFIGPVSAQLPNGGPASGKIPDALKAELESLKAPKAAWLEIAWKSCLLDGLWEAREKKKPVVLWVFIDRPVDDARC